MADKLPLNKDLILREKLALQRTVLANQSTFLAFLRTSMYFTVAGISIKSLLKIPDAALLEYTMFIIAGILFIAGIVNFIHNARVIESNRVHVGNYRLEYLEEDEQSGEG